MGRAEAAQAAAPPPRPEVDDDREVFKFVNEGDEVYGLVVDAKFGLKGGEVDLIEVDDEEHGPITVFLGSMALNQSLVEGANNLGRPVQKGDQVYIVFDGKIPLDGGRTFNQFRIHLEAGAGKAKAAAAAAPSGAHTAAASQADQEELPF